MHQQFTGSERRPCSMCPLLKQPTFTIRHGRAQQITHDRRAIVSRCTAGNVARRDKETTVPELAEYIWLNKEMQWRQVLAAQPLPPDVSQIVRLRGKLRRHFRYAYTLISRPIDLVAQRCMGFQDEIPVCRLPERNRANSGCGVMSGMFNGERESRTDVKVTNALTTARGIRLKLFHHLCGACGTANRRARNNAYTAARYVSDDGISLRAKPMLNSRI